MSKKICKNITFSELIKNFGRPIASDELKRYQDYMQKQTVELWATPSNDACCVYSESGDLLYSVLHNGQNAYAFVGADIVSQVNIDDILEAAGFSIVAPPERKAGAPAGNKNAAKPDEQKRTGMILIPVTPREKAAIVKAAKGRKLAEYCREKLGI